MDGELLLEMSDMIKIRHNWYNRKANSSVDTHRVNLS